MAPTNVKKARQTSLLDIESNPDRLGAYQQPALSATKRANHAPISFDHQAQAFQGHTSWRKLKYRDSWGWRPSDNEAGVRASIQPSEALCIPDKCPMYFARSPLLVGSRRKKTGRAGRRSAFPSALPWLIDNRAACALAESGVYSPDRTCHGTFARAAARYQASRATSSRRAPNCTLEEGHRVDTILNQPNCRSVSQPTGWTASWYKLLRVFPTLHPPKRPSHAPTSKPDIKYYI